MAAPMPLEAPVTTATLPVSFFVDVVFVMVMFLYREDGF
jgi:hypothetical protein